LRAGWEFSADRDGGVQKKELRRSVEDDILLWSMSAVFASPWLVTELKFFLSPELWISNVLVIVMMYFGKMIKVIS
jgi:hypothetical protein